MNVKKPSRVLNEANTVIGLHSLDLIVIGAIYLILQQIFVRLHLELIPLIICVFLALFIGGLRLKARKKVVRDFVKYLFYRLFFSGEYHASASDRKNKR